MQKRLADGVLAWGNGFLEYHSADGACTIMFPCDSQATYDKVNSMQEMNDEYDTWLFYRNGGHKVVQGVKEILYP